MTNAVVMIVAIGIVSIALLGTIAFKRLPKDEQEFIEKSDDMLHEIKKDFYERHCASCVKTCGGIETLDVAKCEFKEEYFEAKQELSQHLLQEEDALNNHH